MNLVLHLLRSDIRRFRILLSLWLLVVAASAVRDGAWPAMAIALEARQTIGLTGGLLSLIEVLFSMALIALVVQEHPLVGTNAFWMTRPIPWRALLGTKLILLTAVIVAAPVIAEIVVMIVYDVPASQMAAVAGQSLFFRTLWLALVMTVAAPTLNLAKFAFAVGGVLIATWTLLMTMSAILLDRAAQAPPTAAFGVYDPTPETIRSAVFIVVVLGFLLVLYGTRARFRAVAIGVAGLVVTFTAGSVWQWPVLAPRTETPAWAFDPSTLQLSAVPDDVDVRAGMSDWGYEASPWTVAQARMRLSNLASRWSSQVSVRESSIRVEGREALISRVPGPPASPGIDESPNQNNVVMRAVLNVERLVEREQHERPDAGVVMVARTADLRQLASDSGVYEGRFLLSLTRHDIAAVLPLRVGAAVRLGAYQFSLDRIRSRQSRISLLARESDASSVFTREPPRRIDYYIRNPVTSEAVQAAWRELGGDIRLGGFLPFVSGIDKSQRSGFRALAGSLEFPSSYGGEPRVVFDGTWIERGELVIVRSTEAGAVERRLAIAGFPLRTE
jgi:hypothetical protein